MTATPVKKLAIAIEHSSCNKPVLRKLLHDFESILIEHYNTLFSYSSTLLCQ